MDRNQAFLEFKSQHEGKTFEDQILSNRADLKEHKQRVKAFTESCNQAKRELDQIKAKLDTKAEEKRMTQQQDGDMMGFEDEMEAAGQG